MGSDLHNCLLTLVERKCGLAILKKLEAEKLPMSEGQLAE